MKYYSEIIEIRKDEKPPKTFQIKVKDKAEAKTEIEKEEKKPEWQGLKYIKRFHICYHEEDIDRNSPCEIQEL